MSSMFHCKESREKHAQKICETDQAKIREISTPHLLLTINSRIFQFFVAFFCRRTKFLCQFNTQIIFSKKPSCFSIDPAQGYRPAYGAASSGGALDKTEDVGGYLRSGNPDPGSRLEENKQPLRPLPPHGYNTHHYQVRNISQFLYFQFEIVN